MFKVLLVLTACYLVLSCKHVPSHYVEHKFIVFSAYNAAVFSGVVLLFTSNPNDDPKAAAIIQAAGVSLGSTIVVGSLALPRLLLATGRITSLAASGSSGSSGSLAVAGTAAANASSAAVAPDSRSPDLKRPS